MTLSRWGGTAALACACAFTTPILAATYVTKTSRHGNQQFEAGTDPHFIDLGESHGTSLTVRTVGATTRLLILLNAECTVAGLTHVEFLNLEILVDGVAAVPSGIGHAFCTSDGDGSLDNWVTAASDASVVVGAGTHSVQLRGSLTGAGVAGNDWWLGDLSLIVIANQQ